MARSDKRTWRGSEDEVYSDFDISFERNPVTGALVRVTNDEAVKQSVVNLVMTMIGEWPHQPALVSKVHRLLFEPLDAITSEMIKDAIVAALRHEDRVALRLVTVKPNYARDGYDLTIVFSIVNRTDPVTFSYLLKRVR